MQIRQVWPSRSGLLYEVSQDGDLVVDVEIDGRRVWSFRQEGSDVPADLIPDGVSPEGLRFQPWPPVLVPRLRGAFRVHVRPSGSGQGAESSVRFDSSSEPPELADLYGRPLVVNKWGRLGHAIADAAPGMVERMLDHMDELRLLLERQLGPIVFVTCGTLLGPVREDGRLLMHDDDADLAYLSRHSHPADVALESFEVGRMLRAEGYEVVRLSVGHLQIHFAHEGVPDHYVDVFPGFMLDGFWLQPFAVRVEASREELLPTTTVMIEGRAEPAPGRPESTLVALYGDGWREPDPSFTFEVPASTAERFYGWFADYNAEREDWDDVFRLSPPAAPGGEEPISAFGRWVHERTPERFRLLELGSGGGADALALAGMGRSVRALDYSRYAVEQARARLGDRPLDVSFEVLNLLDTRQVIRLGAELASTGSSWTVLGRRLLNAVEDRGRENVFRLCSMLLRDGSGPAGAAHFDVVVDHRYAGIPHYRHVSVEQIVAEAAAHGLVLEEAVPRMESLRWFGAAEEQVVSMYRMSFRRRPSR
jgi:hypothetical protein